MTMTVRLPIRDYPLLLEVVEKTTGPVFSKVATASLPPNDGGKDAAATLTFTSSIAGEAEITRGAFPERTGKSSQKAKVKAGENVIEIPSLEEGEGIRLTMTESSVGGIAADGGAEASATIGRTARWPQWDYDPAGARPNFRREPPPNTQGASVNAVTLPPLPEGECPESVTGGFTIVDSIDSLFPALSMADFVYVGIAQFEGHPAWSVKLLLDYAAHPGEKDFDRNYLIVPLKKGFAVRR